MEKQTLEEFVKVPGIGRLALAPLKAGPEIEDIARTAGMDIAYLKEEPGSPLHLPREDAKQLLKHLGARLLTSEEYDQAVKYSQHNCAELYQSLTEHAEPCGGEMLGDNHYAIKGNCINEKGLVPIPGWVWQCFRQFIPETDSTT